MPALCCNVCFHLVSCHSVKYGCSSKLTVHSSWNSYFGSYLQVVHRLDITSAGYVLNAFSLTSYIFSPLFGV